MTRPMPRTDELPYALYRSEQIRHLEQVAIDKFDVSSIELMARAGAACYNSLREQWPTVSRMTVLCGAGNNGGDGFVIARLALLDGIRVQLVYLGKASQMSDSTAYHYRLFERACGRVSDSAVIDSRADLIVDALLGTGLQRDLNGKWRDLVEAVNAHPAPVVAVDIPTGLNADTGQCMGVAVRASMTVTFIGLKVGLFTAAAADFRGRVLFDALELPARIYATEVHAAKRIDLARFDAQLAPRSRSAHKGMFGHVVAIGGAPGMPGAIRLCGEAALRSGAGLVSVITHEKHASVLNSGRPELMVTGVDSASVETLLPLLEKGTAVALGPGLGRGEWSRRLFEACLQCDKPLVLDADALNLLVNSEYKPRDNWVLTPHPGEAARLLCCATVDIESDRVGAARRLQDKFGGTVVLKGAGTIVTGRRAMPVSICSDGNPGMATGGMGDVLTGVIAAFIAGGHYPELAAEMGVCLHAAAGDAAAVDGERGMLASDLMKYLRRFVNAENRS